MLLQVHRKGDWGSPRVVDSKSFSKSLLSVGSVSDRAFAPSTGSANPLGFSSSATPLRTVDSDIPKALATSRTPPSP